MHEKWQNMSVASLHISETNTQTCWDDTMSARCPYSQNILITKARFGHIEVSKCVDQVFDSLGSLGCYANVTDIVGSKCNGKTRCEVACQDTDIVASKTCKIGLPMYLDVTFVCIPGEWISYFQPSNLFIFQCDFLWFGFDISAEILQFIVHNNY